MDRQHADHHRRALLAAALALPAVAILPRVSRAQATWAPAPPPRLEDLLSVADFEAAARAALPPAHFMVTWRQASMTIAPWPGTTMLMTSWRSACGASPT